MIPSYVYRFFTAAGELLYVGCTRHLDQRVRWHRKDRGAEWRIVASMTVEVHADRYIAENAERAAILQENPRWNRQKWHPSPGLEPRTQQEPTAPPPALAPVVAKLRPIRTGHLGPHFLEPGSLDSMRAGVYEYVRAKQPYRPALSEIARRTGFPRAAIRIVLYELTRREWVVRIRTPLRFRYYVDGDPRSSGVSTRRAVRTRPHRRAM